MERYHPSDEYAFDKAARQAYIERAFGPGYDGEADIMAARTQEKTIFAVNNTNDGHAAPTEPVKTDISNAAPEPNTGTNTAGDDTRIKIFAWENGKPRLKDELPPIKRIEPLAIQPNAVTDQPLVIKKERSL